MPTIGQNREDCEKTDRKNGSSDGETIHLSEGDPISESVRVEETALHRSRCQRLFEGLQEQYFLFGVKPNGTIVYVSPAIEKIVGFQPSNVVGKNWRDFVDVNNVVNEPIEELQRSRFDGRGKENHTFRCEISHQDGSTRLIEVRDVPVFDENGDVILSEGIGHDITDRHNSELALQKAHHELETRVRERTAELNRVSELYKSVVDHQTEFIVRWLPNGKQTFVNPAYCKYKKCSKEDLLGTLVPRMSNESAKNIFDQIVVNLKPENPVITTVTPVLQESGLEVWQRWTDHGMFDPSGELVLIQSVGRDITKERRVGQMAQDVAVFRALMENLSPRERQVMEMVTAGKANKVIARGLDLSVKTVEKHRSSMMRKLQVQSVAELVRKVIGAELSDD